MPTLYLWPTIINLNVCPLSITACLKRTLWKEKLSVCLWAELRPASGHAWVHTQSLFLQSPSSCIQTQIWKSMSHDNINSQFLWPLIKQKKNECLAKRILMMPLDSCVHVMTSRKIYMPCIGIIRHPQTHWPWRGEELSCFLFQQLNQYLHVLPLWSEIEEMKIW